MLHSPAWCKGGISCAEGLMYRHPEATITSTSQILGVWHKLNRIHRHEHTVLPWKPSGHAPCLDTKVLHPIRQFYIGSGRLIHKIWGTVEMSWWLSEVIMHLYTEILYTSCRLQSCFQVMNGRFLLTWMEQATSPETFKDTLRMDWVEVVQG